MSVVVSPGMLRVNMFKNLLQFTTCLSNRPNIGVLSTNDINLYKPTYFSLCVCLCVCVCMWRIGTNFSCAGELFENNTV